MTIFMRAFLAITLLAAATVSARAVDVNAAVLRVDYPELIPITRYDLKPDDLGFAGAVLADEDNQTTGGFLGINFATEQVAATPETLDEKLKGVLDQGVRLLVVMAREEDLLRIADQAGPDVLVLNATAPDMALRDGQCRGNLSISRPACKCRAMPWCNSPCGRNGGGSI